MMPKAAAQNSDIVVGGPYSSGILAGGAHFEYQQAPPEILARVECIKRIADRHDAPIKAAALQFSLAHPASAAIIPGASRPERIAEDHAALKATIPGDFWRDMRQQALVAANAPLHRVVGVFGVGGLGGYAVQYAKLLGSGAKLVAFGRNPDKLKIARRYGADHVVSVKGKSSADIAKELNQTVGQKDLDAIMDCAGAPEMMQLAFSLLSISGHYADVGLVGDRIDIPHSRAYRANKPFMARFGATTRT